MLNFYSGSSKLVNPKKAINESINSAIKDVLGEIKLVIIHTTSGHNCKQLLDAIHKRLDNVSVIGCSGSGVISNDFVNETVRCLALTVVTGDEFVLTKIEGLTIENSLLLSKNAAEELNAKNDSINMIMAFAPGIVVNGEDLVNGISSVFGNDIPILGGLAGFNGTVPKTPLLFNNEILEQAVVMVGFYDKTLSVVQSSHHGYLPHKSQKFEITKMSGTFIDELNGKLAWPTLMESFNLPSSTQPSEVISLLALGTTLSAEEQNEYGNEYKLRAPLLLSEDGNSMMLQSNVSEGTYLISCQRDEKYLMNGIDGLNTRITSQYNGKKPVAVFQTDCMARGRMSNGVIEKEEIINNLQDGIIGKNDIAWLGMYAFGEFCRLNGKNQYHNYTSSISVILR